MSNRKETHLTSEHPHTISQAIMSEEAQMRLFLFGKKKKNEEEQITKLTHDEINEF